MNKTTKTNPWQWQKAAAWLTKRMMAIFCLALLCGAANAQGVLEVTDVSKANDFYSGEDDRAAVIIRCNKQIPLSFSSTMDKSAAPYSTRLEGSDSIYNIEFPTGRRYRGRVLSIIAPGYATVEWPLELQAKQAITLQVTDPNSLVDAGCYRQHRNKGVQELKACHYEEALNQFIVATQCSDVDSVENNGNIRLVNQILNFREQGDSCYKLLDYRAASRAYENVTELNPSDDYAQRRYVDCISKYSNECEVMMRQAESYYNDKQYEKAKVLYQSVVDNKCMDVIKASERLTEIDRFMKSKKEHARVITYEYMQNAPIGFSTGKYNMHRAGGFFSLNMNTKLFELARGNYELDDMPELNINFGWTLKIVNPVWIFFGPGVTGKAYYGDYATGYVPNKDGKPINEDTEESADASSVIKDFSGDPDDLKVNIGVAISPTVGICVKYSYFALRLSYQYRFAMKKHLEDFMGKSRFSIGVGVAF